MRAFALPSADAEPAVLELPDPVPGPGEVLVRVAASSLNGFDSSVASGRLQGMMEYRFPVVIGKDFAGTVEAVGEDVTRFAPGDAVFGVVMTPHLAQGGIGELLVVGQDYAITAVPDGLELPTAGALGLAGTAAQDALAAAGLKPGATVLISGATGGVGTLAVQYAVNAGATVIATARPGDDTEFVTDLGAQHTVDHTADLPAQVHSIAPDGVDAVLHLAGGGAALADLLAPGGAIASTLGYGADQHPAAVFVMADPGRRHPRPARRRRRRRPDPRADQRHLPARTGTPGPRRLPDRRARQAGHPGPMTARQPPNSVTSSPPSRPCLITTGRPTRSNTCARWPRRSDAASTGRLASTTRSATRTWSCCCAARSTSPETP
jgi:NADPH:quinone reductase-like Zn-dependent oxidoreductase